MFVQTVREQEGGDHDQRKRKLFMQQSVETKNKAQGPSLKAGRGKLAVVHAISSAAGDQAFGSPKTVEACEVAEVN